MFIHSRLFQRSDTVSVEENAFVMIISPATKNHVLVSYFNNHYVCLILAKFGFCRQFDIEVSNIKYYENPSSASCVDTCGEMDRRTDREKDGRS
jgi:hypothetical protein